MNDAASVLVIMAGAFLVVLGCLSIAMIEHVWMRWTALVLYLALAVGIVLGLPVVLIQLEM